MRRFLAPFALVLLHWNTALGAESLSLEPVALKAIAIAGDAGSPTFAPQNVGATYELRARDFASGAVRNNLVYLRFDLSPLREEVIETATLQFNRIAGDTLTTDRFALYGLEEQPGNLAQDWTAQSFVAGAEFDASMFYDFLASSGACPVRSQSVADFSLDEAVSGNTARLSSSQFVAFLQTRVDAGGQATLLLGMPSQGAGNDKKLSYAFPGYADPALVVNLALAYSAAPVPVPANLELTFMTVSATPSLTLDWDPVAGALRYEVYRRAAGESTPELVATTLEPSYFDPTVELFGAYYYSVDAVTERGESALSPELEVRVIDTTLGQPTAPSDLHTTQSGPARIELEWDAVPGALFYEVYRATEADGTFALLQRSSASSFSDAEGVQGFRSYSYRVKTISAGGISRFSETLTVVPRFGPGARPSRPRNVRSTSRSAYEVELTWEASRNAQAYYVWRSTEEERGYTLVGITETNSLTDTFGVYPENAYYYFVDAVGGAGFSPSSATRKVDAAVTSYKRVEALSRAPIAVSTPEGVLVSWRLLGTDRPGIGFYVYRDGQRLNLVPIWDTTTFLDPTGNQGSTYEVRAALGLFDFPGGEAATRLPSGYWPIPIQAPPAGVTPDGAGYSYSANDASAADLDGDGSYELILKWDPSNSRDNADDGFTGNVFIDAYTLSGTLLWRVDLGRNVRAGAHYTPFLVYDFDGDGRAEMLCKTADGTIDGDGMVLGDANADHRNSVGRVLAGPEYLTLFDGGTGAALSTIDYVPQRGNVADWGDNYGNRVDRFNAGVAYLDGVHPSAFFERGYYRGQSGLGDGITVVAAFDVREGQLSQRWVFDTRLAGSQYAGQGNHQVAAADVDGDGKQEVVLGSLVLDDDGRVLYSTGLGHGDAMHLGDLDPRRPGLELFSVKEDPSLPYQTVLSAAATGATLWGSFNGADTGRGLAADIDPNYGGSELWGAANSNVWSVSGAPIGQRRPAINFAVWWDGDTLRELLDQTSVRKWDSASQREMLLLDAVGAASNNGTKATPCLQADLLGDWREEVVLRSADNAELRVYTTSAPTSRRLPTLMHDPAYRVAVATQNSGYNQPPHPSFFIGNNMPAVAMPQVFVDPVPAFLGLKLGAERFVGPVIVLLGVNGGDRLHNEYRVDEGEWAPYSLPFVVRGRGAHTVAFRTLDSADTLLAAASRTLTIER